MALQNARVYDYVDITTLWSHSAAMIESERVQKGEQCDAKNARVPCKTLTSKKHLKRAYFDVLITWFPLRSNVTGESEYARFTYFCSSTFYEVRLRPSRHIVLPLELVLIQTWPRCKIREFMIFTYTQVEGQFVYICILNYTFHWHRFDDKIYWYSKNCDCRRRLT